MDGLPELVVGNAEHGAVRHRRQLVQHGLDLSGIDVDAARDDHVDLPIAQVEVALLVEVADVAWGEQPVTVGGAALGLVAVIGEVGVSGGAAGDDLAGLPHSEDPSVLVDHLHLRALQRLAHRTRMFEPLSGLQERDRPDLRRAIVLVDHRSPPFDHRLLGLRRAWRGGVDDEPQR